MSESKDHEVIPSRDYLERAADFHRLLGCRVRLEVLYLLATKPGVERSVKELNRLLGAISQSALSQHLGKMREAGLVTTRRESQTIYYSIRDEKLAALVWSLADTSVATVLDGG